MFAHRSQAIYACLQERGILRGNELDAIHEAASVAGKPLADLLLERGLCDRATLLATVAEYLGYDHVVQVPSLLPTPTVAQLPERLARTYGAIPWRMHEGGVEVLVNDPFAENTVDDLTFALGREVRLVVADPDQVDGLIQRYYGEDRPGGEEPLVPSPTGDRIGAETVQAAGEPTELAEQAPLIHFVNLVLAQAIRDHASDVHFEPFEHEFKIRYRIDGVLYEMTPPPQHLAPAITSRLKVLANLDIAERRLPQDGRIALTLDGRAVDLRISTLPTQFGESVVLRVLDRTAVQLEIEQLGLPADVLAGMQATLRRPNGMLVVTGPTGSGKTTTLYSGLRKINTPDLKLLTIEDPVEYEIEGIMQVPVNPAAGLTFASALRSFLRQDPDVIMVGEIRDLPTAQISIQASLTGHLVLSTLHTNDAAGAITRLIDLGVEPFLIASSLEAVLAQRLVRRVCPSCCVAYSPSPALLEQLQIAPELLAGRTFWSGRGCDQCAQTGYRGRLGLFEWLRVDEAIRELIGEKAPPSVIRQKAIEAGMRTLRDSGVSALLAGHTTAEEVLRCT